MKELNDGSVLLNLISQLGELEWKRYQQRYPSMYIDGKLQEVDHTSYPPFTSFRFKNENHKIIQLITNYLKSYKGQIEWVIVHTKKEYGSGINHCILPKYVNDLKFKLGENNKKHTVYKYIAANFPSFGKKAYIDLMNLTHYLNCKFKKEGLIS